MKKILLTITACVTAILAMAQPLLRPDNIDEVLSAMTLEEKAALLVGGGKEFPGRAKGLPAGSTRAFERYGIPMTYLADGPAGVRVNHPCTGFPIGTLLASSWDTSLVEEVASAMGEEARAYDVGLLLAPGLNIHRNPLCGRNFEYFSEDPLLTGKMASAYVKGVQSHGVGATVKHFAANNQETLRTTMDVRVGERALREIYLKGFEIAVKEAAPWAVMASYNQLNGDYTQQKKELLTGILRDEWGFDGLVMTDWGFKAGTVKAVQAGNDLMEPGYDGEIRNILEAVKYGKLDVADIDRNARRILEYIVKTPVFLGQPGSGAPDLEGHAKLSIRAAAEGMILLKNDGALPLKAGQKIAVLDLSKTGFVAGGTGSGSIGKGGVTSLADALNKAGFEISDDADAAVVTIGRRAGEAKDRVIPDDFCLTAAERSQLEHACATYGKVVVVLNVCGVMETASWKDLPAAILLPWAPGRDGAFAVSDVLSGKVNPSGKLPMTFPVDYWDDPSSANFPSDSTSAKPFANYEEGIYVGYRYYSTVGKAVSYPFGYGLSYTSFAYSKPKVKICPDAVEVRITVKNTGSVPGREAVQLYVSAPSGGLDKPVRELRAFAKTRLLAPGEKETLVLRLSPYDLASYNEQSSAWETAAGEYKFHLGASAEDIRATVTASLKESRTWPVKRRCIPAGPYATTVEPLPGECWWGAVIEKGYVQPFQNFDSNQQRLPWQEIETGVRNASLGKGKPYDLGLHGSKGFTAPLLLSNKGRYVWSDRPFAFEFQEGVLHLVSKYEPLAPVTAGKTLKEAYLAACQKHFPFDGREPASLMFTKPQFNNWIETVVLGINQENAEKFVDALHESGFPCGVVMIDGGWQRYHGCRDFNPDTFPDATKLFDKIHDYGYKGILWCSYFLTPDSRPEYVNYRPGGQNILVRRKDKPNEAALVWWWSGISVTMDLTAPAVRKKFTDELKVMAERFHFDGFKFDGGDPEYFRENALFSEPWMEPADFGHAFNLVGLEFPYNEYRAGFKAGGLPLVLRLHDVGHSWEELGTIVPDMLVAGLCGQPYVFADMIGGGLSSCFYPGKSFSHKLFIRSCQIQALTPMMQFSAAPWRVLTPEECEICRKYANLHVDFGPYIMEQVHHASATGEPIMRSMEYEFPGCGYEKVDTQFMLGPKYLVAPVVREDDSVTVYLPAGRWKDDQGKNWRGPKVLNLTDVPLERLPFFERVK